MSKALKGDVDGREGFYWVNILNHHAWMIFDVITY